MELDSEPSPWRRCGEVVPGARETPGRLSHRLWGDSRCSGQARRWGGLCPHTPALVPSGTNRLPFWMIIVSLAAALLLGVGALTWVCVWRRRRKPAGR